MEKWIIYISPYHSDLHKNCTHKLEAYSDDERWGLICGEDQLKKAIKAMQNTLSVIKQYGQKALDKEKQIKKEFIMPNMPGSKKFNKKKFPIKWLI